MSEGAVYIIVCSFSISLAASLAHSRYDGKQTRFALGIILICAMLSPLGEIFSSLGSIELPPASGEAVDGIYEEQLELAYAEGIREAVTEKLSLDAELVSVEIEGFCEEELSCSLCRIILRAEAVFSDLGAVRSLALDCGAEKCEVVIDL